MRICKAALLQILLCIKFCGTLCSTQTLCAYKDNDFRINHTLSMSGGQDVRQMLEVARGRHQPLLTADRKYERCVNTQGPSHCYTLWAQSPAGGTPVVVRQGCWIPPTGARPQPTQCVASSCGNARLKANATFDFCCCQGDRCNDASSGPKPVTKAINSGAPETFDVVKKADDRKGKFVHEYTLCAFRLAVPDSGGSGLGEVLPDGKTARCARNTFCFSYYTTDPSNKSRISIEYQGCWDDHDNRNTCNSSVCTPHEEPNRNRKQYSSRIGNDAFFCCCLGDMCNNNISQNLVPYIPKSTASSGPELRHLHDSSYKDRTILISLSSVTVVAICVLALFLVYKFSCRQTHIPMEVTSSVEVPTSPAFNMDDLKISCLLNKGRFSEVWKGSLDDQDVAVKIYLFNYRQYYYNEKYIYSLPFMEHENILKFYGGEERISQDGSVEHLLVLQYIPDGTLVNYLKNNTLDWYTMCKMCQSLARGMAHLHTDIDSGESSKPTIAHRDLNSRNILVKPDLSLVIADLGFCMPAMGSKLIRKGHMENAEQTSLTDVGTLRYMAPELLDGAVNLRDCEGSLKQIDMYAYGLAMWEISSRCADLYQGCPMPEFALPYQAEVGTHPSFEEMQLLVSRNKTRPKFPEVWKDYHQAIRALKETIEECWDHDAEARLTAMCVEERVVEMRVLWSHDNRNKGVTPTINTALLSHVSNSNRTGYHGNGQTQWGGLSSMSESSAPNTVAEGNTSALIINDIRREGSSTLSNGDSMSNIPSSWVTERRGSFSTSTMETTVAATPSEPALPPSHPKSQNINALKNQPVPPHQGRNAIVERNTHKRSDEELAVVGNNLLYSKDAARRNEADRTVQSPVTDSDLDHLTDGLETSLMQNDALSRQRSPPINYLQNQVHHVRLNSTGSSELPPKVVNNPGERQDNLSVSHVANASTSHSHALHGTKTKKAKEMGIFGHLALLGRLAFSSKFEGKKCLGDDRNISRVEGGTMYDSIGQHNPLFRPSEAVETEVRLANGGPVVRPAQLRTKPNVSSNGLQDMSRSNLNRNGRPNEQSSSIEARESVSSSGQGNDSPVFSRLRGAPYSKSTSDLSPQKTSMACLSKSDEEAKCSRPSTLAVKGHNYSNSKARGAGGSLNSLSLSKSGNGDCVQGLAVGRAGWNGYRLHNKPVANTKIRDGVEKIKMRIKTPLSDKHGRLSLYDDRLMTEGEADMSKGTKLHKTSMSLQQCKSIDETCVNVYNDCTC